MIVIEIGTRHESYSTASDSDRDKGASCAITLKVEPLSRSLPLAVLYQPSQPFSVPRCVAETSGFIES